MEEKNTPLRSHWVHLRLKASEHETLLRKWRATPCRTLSDFVRIKIFDQPLTVLQHNATVDAGLQELSLLREELRAVGNNLNQITRHINASPALAGDRNWYSGFLTARSELMLRLEALSGQLTNLSSLWLQS
ncbi:MAG: plasmid mobilization relaxosome protein MobC [Bacteroidia bacterium]